MQTHPAMFVTRVTCSCLIFFVRLSIALHYRTVYNDRFLTLRCKAVPGRSPVLVACLQVFDGNVDAYSVKHYYLDDAVLARYIKFHTVQWHRHPSMRVEVIGCQGLCLLNSCIYILFVHKCSN